MMKFRIFHFSLLSLLFSGILSFNAQGKLHVKEVLSGFDKPCLLCNPKENHWREDIIILWFAEHRPHLKLLAYDKKRKRVAVQCQLDNYLFVTNWHQFYNGFSDCAKCKKIARLTAEEIRECYHQDGASKGEMKFMDWVEEEGYKVIRNDREQLGGQEIDGFIPDHNLGIEHNGLYHHSLTKKTNTSYHKNKFLMAQEKGIHLFQFWEDEFIHKEAILKSMVLAKLNSPKVVRLFARKCVLGSVPMPEARAFLKENHLQGGYGGKALGLFYKGELVMVVTYPRRVSIVRPCDDRSW